MTLLFLAAALLQWNDPDPLLWIAAYGGTAWLTARHALGKRVPMLACSALGLALAAWALSLSPSMLEVDAAAYTTWAMKDRLAEEARESIGLWLAAASLGWLTLAIRRTPPH